MARIKLTAEAINDRIFMAFPAGWFAGTTSGAVYAGFNWNNLQIELGRTLCVAVTVSQVVTCILVSMTMRKIIKRGLAAR